MGKGKLKFISAVCVAFLLAPLCGTSPPSTAAAKAAPPLSAVIDAVRKEVRPDQAMDFMRHIYSTDRWFTFPKFAETADYLQQTMHSIGLEDVEVLGAPADGVTQAGFWTMPLAWDITQGRLEITSPALAPELRLLAHYQQVPSSIGMWSGSTPPDGVEAEIVELPTSNADEIARLNLRGKLLLSRENPAGIKWALARAGALGAINTFTENPALENDRQWINAWGDNGWAFTKGSTPLLSFSITPRQAALVRQLLAQGAHVTARATVASRYYSGTYPYVTGIIRGTGTEEVLTLGHSSEQGAEDNATGVSALLEALATLNRLIDAGELPRPRRSIRILNMGELYGTMHYLVTHPDRSRQTVAALCLDTPAAAYSLAGTEYTFYMNPEVASSYVDAFILRVAADYLRSVNRPWHEHPFMPGTDSYLGEPTIDIPTVWAYSGSGVETHHNSADTPDRVDSRSLRDITIIDAAYLYYLANAADPEARWLAEVAQDRGLKRLVDSAAPFFDRVAAAQESDELGRVLHQANERITYTRDRQIQAVRSVQRLVEPQHRAGLNGALAPLAADLNQFAGEQADRVAAAANDRARSLGLKTPVRPAAAPNHPEAERIIVTRKRPGTIPLDDLAPDKREGYPSGAWDTVATIALYWCDGHRTLAEVAHLTQMELGPADFDFIGYFKFLRRHGYVDFVQ